MEFSEATDPKNYRGTNRISLSSRKFSHSAIQEIVARRIRYNTPASIFIMTEERTLLSIERAELEKAAHNPRGRAELIESLAAVISHSKLFCIEEEQPHLESPSSSSPGGLQTLFEAR